MCLYRHPFLIACLWSIQNLHLVISLLLVSLSYRKHMKSIQILNSIFLNDLAYYRLESLVNVLCRLSWCLDKLHIILRRKFLTFLKGYLTLILHIAFVPHEYLLGASLTMFLNFTDPSADIVKSPSICHIINYYNPMGATIIWRSDGFESFLARGIPNL